MAKYKLSDKAPIHNIENWDEKTGLYTFKQVKGLRPFGVQCGLITNENLTEPIAEWLLQKPEFALFIEVEKQLK